ncbi:hypothetical protein I5M74_24615 [Serratia marcescens]|nr:hypothetical protein [Serratia marcescens]
MKRKSLMTGLVLVISLVMNGCHSSQHISLKQQPFGEGHYYITEPPLYAGDKIKYQLKTGQKGELTVESISPQSIIGTNHITLPLNQLSSLEKREISKTKTGAAVVGGTAVATVAIVVVLSLAIGGFVAAAAG